MEHLRKPDRRSRDEMGHRLDELRQEYEQLLVKLEDAEAEAARASEHIRRLEAELVTARNAQLRQRQAILELREGIARREEQQTSQAHAAGVETDILREELQLANEELRVSHEQLGDSNRALQEANAGLEARVAERTEQLERVVLELSDAVAQRDALLEAQSVLAREVDHRVKNSLQMVVSLLAMQAAAADSEMEQRALQQACSRVQAIAHTHGLLYKTRGAENVPFQDFLAALCQDLSSSLAPEQSGRTIECHADPVDLPADYALPLALVVNELVTNALKHAFPNRSSGRVEVSFTRRGARGWRLTVADDGVGLASWPPPPSARSFGARIVGTLVARLHGKLAVSTGDGTCFTVDIEPEARCG